MPILLKGCKSDLCAVLSEVSHLPRLCEFTQIVVRFEAKTLLLYTNFKPFISKSLERVVVKQLNEHFSNELFTLKSFSQDLECRMAQKLHQLKSYGLLTINCLACKTLLQHSISLTKYVTAEIRTHCWYQEYGSESHVSHMQIIVFSCERGASFHTQKLFREFNRVL